MSLLTKQDIAIARGDEEYDALTPAEEVAAKRGMVVVFPEDNQLQTDIDSDEQYYEFDRRFCAVEWDALYPATVKVAPSASGLPNRHATVTCQRRTFTTVERLMWQAALNDDPHRVFLNAIRFANGQDRPSRFFEKPVDPMFDDL